MGILLKDKVAVVTGAGRGIGRGEALALAAEGAKVVVNDAGCAPNGTSASISPADEVVGEIKKQGGIAIASYDSVASWESGQRIIQTAIESFGRVDILVNNAGIMREAMVFEMSEEDWDAVIKVHLYGHFYCTRFASAIMKKQRNGRIINTSSLLGLGTPGSIGRAHYSAAKEGIVGFTKALAAELGQYGVTCNAIRPRGNTRMVRGCKDFDPEVSPYRELVKLSPEDVASLVVYLSSDLAAKINGYVFLVAGGMIGVYPEPLPIRTINKDGRWTVEELDSIVPKDLIKDLVNC